MTDILEKIRDENPDLDDVAMFEAEEAVLIALAEIEETGYDG